jgi:hypothetical protein
MLTCEKLLHGNREFKPFPLYHSIDSEGKKVKIKQPHYPYKCERLAQRYRVSGQSFTAFAVLCKSHARQAEEKDGLKLVPEVEA